MDVLHVTQPTIAGVKRVVLDLVKDQSQRGLDVAVACPSDSSMTDALDELCVRHIPWTASRSPGPSVLKETWALRRIVRNLNPKVVHLHSSKAGLAGRLAVRGSIPTVFHPHGWSFLAVNGPVKAATLAWERFACRWTDVTICVSDSERRLGAETGLRSTWEVIQNGVDLDIWNSPTPYSRDNARTELNLPLDAVLAVCVGRLQRQKGQDLLLNAWQPISERFPNARLLLVGDGPDRDELEAVAGDRVTFVGQRNDVRNWMLAADLIVMPSRWEGLSLAMLEAMACGCAIIATDVSGMQEAAGDDAACIVPPEDIGNLRLQIERMIEAPEERDALGKKARARVEKHFDFKTTCEHVRNVYSRLSGLRCGNDRSIAAERDRLLSQEVVQ
ncbi:MAG: glycosyltransferase family 4 protein [Planctomycetaceae bacterium]|nr:glycosyltransferase family 4 protein [Planctomycetaceae bacterium]